MADMATVFRAFGRCASGRVDGTAEEEHAALASALETLRRRRATLESVLIGDPRIRHGLWELNAALVTTVDRMLLELDTTMITPDLDQRRTAQALARLRAAVHDATHEPTREPPVAKNCPSRPNARKRDLPQSSDFSSR
jgi:hypothetical protein